MISFSFPFFREIYFEHDFPLKWLLPEPPHPLLHVLAPPLQIKTKKTKALNQNKEPKRQEEEEKEKEEATAAAAAANSSQKDKRGAILFCVIPFMWTRCSQTWGLPWGKVDLTRETPLKQTVFPVPTEIDCRSFLVRGGTSCLLSLLSIGLCLVWTCVDLVCVSQFPWPLWVSILLCLEDAFPWSHSSHLDLKIFLSPLTPAKSVKQRHPF